MACTTWCFTVRARLKKVGGSMTITLTRVSAHVASVTSNPTYFEKMRGIEEYIEERYPDYEVVDIDIIECHH